jgi:peroxiredoxin
MPAYQADLPKFAELDAQVVGISPDSPFCHVAWQRHEIDWLDYPLLSDFHPHGAVAEAYGVRRENPVPLPGISERAVFVVDKEGRIAFARVYELSALPPNSEVLDALRRLSVGAAQ